MSISLKKWIASILESIVTKHEDCTLVTSVATGGYIRAYRTGNVVMLKIQGVSLNTFSTRTQIATIPEGYRPVEEAYGLLNNQPVTEYVLASSNGALSVQASAYAGTRWGTLIYIVGGALRNPVIARLLAIFKNGGGLDAKVEDVYSEAADLAQRTHSLCVFYKEQHFVLDLLWNNLIRHLEDGIHAYSFGKRLLKSSSASLLLLGNKYIREHCNYRSKPTCIRNDYLITVDNNRSDVYPKRLYSELATSEGRWCSC